MLRIILTMSVAFTALSTGTRAEAAGTGTKEAGPIQLAQLYDPGDEIYHDRRIRVFIDPTGKRVTMDRRGRILSIEEPGYYDRNQYGQPQAENWGDGPVGGGAPNDGFGYSQDDGYYPAPPPSPRYRGNRDGQVQRSQLPPNDSTMTDPTGTASISPDMQPAQPATIPNSVPNSSDMAPAVVMPKGSGAKTKIAAFQILLDRAGSSPGVVDGRPGSNVDKAAAAYTEITGKTINPSDEAAVNAELEATGGQAFVQYEISNEDVGRQYVASIPDDYAHKAQLPAMAYTSVTEMLGEKFHIDVNYLKEINPGVNFNQPGTMIQVPNLGKHARAKVASIIADKARKQVRGYDESGRLVVAYPSTIGSSDTPSPSGKVEVVRIAMNPNYTYNPKINFKQGNNDKVLTIPPGPNGPVGTVWIALSKPTYGIHGTPEPSKIGKTSSHGCVRLANWDAEELAKLVKPGVTVEFTE